MSNTSAGTITVDNVGDGDIGEGIYSDYATTTITNAGTITTSGSSGYGGIYAGGANAIISNTGVITTGGDDAYGIFLDANDGTVTNAGSISTEGEDAYGIGADGDNSTITNSGSISTTGHFAYGIHSEGATATITNSGSITTEGFLAYGIDSDGANATITNAGSITTSGGDGYGTYSTGANSVITNSGSITTSGNFGYGTYSAGENSVITNSGSITTNAGWSTGIHSEGATATITNSGSITTSDYYQSRGILSLGDNTTITNTGTISTIGREADGIISYSDNTTITNTGTIRATGADAAAINLGRFFFDADNNTVNLNRGSVIVGDIVAEEGADNATLNLNLGAGASYAYSVTGDWTVNDLDNRPMVEGSAYAAGIGAQETASEMLYQRTAAMSGALDRRLHAYALNAEEITPYWLDVYYADSTRNSGGNYSTQTAFSHFNYGINAGFRLPVEITPLELVINVNQSDLNIDSGNQKIDSTSVMVGLLAPNIAELGGAKLSAKALLGYANHDGDRQVLTNSLDYDGSRNITSDYNSVYGVVGAALIKTQPITDKLSAEVLLGLDLAAQRVESYRESDYFAWDRRTLTQLQSRIQAGLDYRFDNGKGSVFARVGAEHRDLLSGATQDYTIEGEHVSFNSHNQTDTYLTAQLGTRMQLAQRVQLFGVVNSLHSADSVNSVQGNIGLNVGF